MAFRFFRPLFLFVLLCITNSHVSSFIHKNSREPRYVHGRIITFDGIPGLNEQDDMANACTPWSIADDQLLYQETLKGRSVIEICAILCRGHNGVKLRLKDINNQNHQAHRRLFGLPMKQPSKLRPCNEIVQRILWDPALLASEFSFTYRDRFDGIVTVPMTSINENVKGKERMLVNAIPEHRIEVIRYRERTVWSKTKRLDMVCGSSGGIKIQDVIGGYDEWFLLEEAKNNQRLKNIKLFCEIDNILADFDEGVYRNFKKGPAQISPKELWSGIASIADFYASLKWMDGGMYIWEAIKGLNVTILTSSPTQSEHSKLEWCRRELGTDVTVEFTAALSKPDYCLQRAPEQLMVELEPSNRDAGDKTMKRKRLISKKQQNTAKQPIKTGSSVAEAELQEKGISGIFGSGPAVEAIGVSMAAGEEKEDGQYILIDRRGTLREPWEARGGVFIHHSDARSTIASLLAANVISENVFDKTMLELEKQGPDSDALRDDAS